MTSFQDLPLELLVIILECTDDVSTLLDCCLVSRRLGAIAQSVLYQSFVKILPSSPHCLRYPLPLLTRTIVSCPRLSANVRDLDIDASVEHGPEDSPEGDKPGNLVNTSGTDNTSGLLGLYGGDIKAFIKNLQGFPTVPRDAWIHSLHVEPSVLTLLLLLHMPNLRRLVISVDKHSLRSLKSIIQLSHGGVPGLPFMSNLRRLHLRCPGADQENQVVLRDILPLLSFPSLEQLWIDRCSNDDVDESLLPQLFNIPPGTLSLSMISFRQSCVNAASIQMLIRACTTLKSFRYGIGTSNGTQFNPEELYSALYDQKNNLEEVRVNLSSMEHDFAPAWENRGFGSFYEFDKLKILGVDQPFLKRLPDFPGSLQHLLLQCCQSPVFKTMSHVATQSTDGVLPLLTEVSLFGDVLYPGRMLDLPSRGATDVLFDASCQKLSGLFSHTAVDLQFEGDLLERTADDYDFAFTYGIPGAFWPLIYLL